MAPSRRGRLINKAASKREKKGFNTPKCPARLRCLRAAKLRAESGGAGGEMRREKCFAAENVASGGDVRASRR